MTEEDIKTAPAEGEQPKAPEQAQTPEQAANDLTRPTNANMRWYIIHAYSGFEQGKTEAQGEVREERDGAHHRRPVRELQRHGGRSQRRPLDPQDHGHDLRARDPGGTRVWASRKSSGITHKIKIRRKRKWHRR